MSLYTEISFVIYAAVVISMSIFLYDTHTLSPPQHQHHHQAERRLTSLLGHIRYVFVKYIERTHKRYGPRSPKYQRWHGVRKHTTYTRTQTCNALLTHQHHHHLQLHSFIYPTLSGALGAQSVLFAKSTAELVKAGFR